MKGKQVTALGLAAMMGMSLLAGCSGGSAETGKETKKTSDGKTELELFGTKTENKETLQKLVDAYNESQDKVTVKLTQPGRRRYGFENPHDKERPSRYGGYGR